MNLVRHIQASSWHAVLALLQAWLNAIRHQYVAQCCAPRLNAVHWQLIDMHQASIWLNAVHQASMWLCIMHQYGSMLYILGSIICIRHQYGLILCIRHQYGPMWPIAVYQASLCHNMPRSMLCRHQFMAWCYTSGITILKPVASCINKARCGASMTQAVHHASIWLNAA